MDWFLPSLKLIKRSAGAIAFAYRPQQFAVYYSDMHIARAFIEYTGCPWQESVWIRDQSILMKKTSDITDLIHRHCEIVKFIMQVNL